VFNDCFSLLFCELSFVMAMGQLASCISRWNIMSMLYGEAESLCHNTPYDKTLLIRTQKLCLLEHFGGISSKFKIKVVKRAVKITNTKFLAYLLCVCMHTSQTGLVIGRQ
jgi:hypothetical protein